MVVGLLGVVGVVAAKLVELVSILVTEHVPPHVHYMAGNLVLAHRVNSTPVLIGDVLVSATYNACISYVLPLKNTPNGANEKGHFRSTKSCRKEPLSYLQSDILSERVPVKTWINNYVFVFSDLMPFFVEILLICVCLRPTQKKALNDNVRRTLLPLSRCLAVD